MDGEIRMMASPELHQLVRRGLENELAVLCPDELEVASEIEIKLAPLRRRIPDVPVVDAERFHATTSQLLPDQVTLVAEVVSPGSESRDREVKPRCDRNRAGQTGSPPTGPGA